MAVEYFCAYHSYLDALEPLTDAERGRLFVACLEYSKSGTTRHLSGNERFLFPMMRAQIDRDNETYKNKCKKQSDNVSKRWNRTDTNDTAVYVGIEKIPPYKKDTDDTKEKEKEKEKAKEKAKEKEKEKEKEIYNSANKCVSTPAPSVQPDHTPTPKAQSTDFSPFTFSPALDAKLRQWFTYKAQRREGYTQQGKQALLSQIAKYLESYPDSALCALIDECMASNWKSVVFDRLAKNPAAYLSKAPDKSGRRELDADEQAAIRRMFPDRHAQDPEMLAAIRRYLAEDKEGSL